MIHLFLKQLFALGLMMMLLLGMGSFAASAASGIPVGSMLLSSCSYIPDYSTQEYRPADSDSADSDSATPDSATPDSVQDAPEDSVSEQDPSGSAAAAFKELEDEQNQLNVLQRFWQGLFGR
ncbi:MAG: hypothetical protein HC924_02575 [Synechococcaceae cyanobacterium SM2_3_2]|nr:hypothetical protein [Synechococcaceae cyanobacterium SM2_3_2]